MKRLIITGGIPLRGEADISGFKNAALPILYATILTADISVIENLPRIRDVMETLSILRAIGAVVVFSDPHTVLVDTRSVTPCRAPDAAVAKLRASSYLLGAELGRFGKTRVALPGGCRIGARPLDYHVRVLRVLGANVFEEAGSISAVAPRLSGARIMLPGPSVGATVNAILASVLAEGESEIVGAAREPHVVDLCRYLRAAGAKIEGDGTSAITVFGVPARHGTNHRLMPDMIEAGTLLTAVGAAGGEICLRGADVGHLASLIEPLSAMGMSIREEGRSLIASRNGLLTPFDLVAGPYPALPTDMHPQLSALATLATGTSVLYDRVFPDRVLYVRELRKMGADIRADGGRVEIRPSHLRGAQVRATDLRAGAALAVAALATRGKTTILDAAVLERGYEDIAGKLRSLGATATSL